MRATVAAAPHPEPVEGDRGAEVSDLGYSGDICQLIDKLLGYLPAMTSTVDDLRALAWELRRTFRELAAAADRGLQPLGISVGDRALLEFLSRESAPVSLSELARKHAVSRQHVHQALRHLPDPTWVEFLADPSDARAKTVRLTPAGRAFWRRVLAWEEDFFCALAEAQDADEVRRASDFLRRLRAEISNFQEPSDGPQTLASAAGRAAHRAHR